MEIKNTTIEVVKSLLAQIVEELSTAGGELLYDEERINNASDLAKKSLLALEEEFGK